MNLVRGLCVVSGVSAFVAVALGHRYVFMALFATAIVAQVAIFAGRQR
jgi:hypothetical protein